MSLSALKKKLIEIVKYDYQFLKGPVTLFFVLQVFVLCLLRKHSKAMDVLSFIFRTGWAGSFAPALWFARYCFVKHKNSIGDDINREFVDSVQPLSNTQKFFDDPDELFEGVVIVLKPFKGEPNGSIEKGVLLIKYSYYFALFAKLFDWESVQNKFHIVLEPSWAGYCEKSILLYTHLPSDVFVMAYEDRDKSFLLGLESNLVPVDIGPSWWVDHRVFKPSENLNRDIDVLMVASWSSFKRHSYLLKALSQLNKKGKRLNLSLVGYPGDMTLEDIKALAHQHGVFEQTTFYEWITPEEVSDLMRRAKVNVLWSRFEGNNRSIIEGMFCDTPCVIRAGHNYGQHYDYINSQTGMFSSEAELSSTLEYMVENFERFSPREYVLNNRSCLKATELLNAVIRTRVEESGGLWTQDIVPKVNELHGMHYYNSGSAETFTESYNFLRESLRKN